MRTLVHLGDLFVGSAPSEVLSALSDTVARLQPDLLAFCGNLTGHGTEAELKTAKGFLETLPSPQVVVPGDKDIAALLSNPFSPLDGFRNTIEGSSTPCFADSEMVVVGLNSARKLVGKRAKVNDEESVEAKRLVEAADPGAVRVLVTYRPLPVDLFSLQLTAIEGNSKTDGVHCVPLPKNSQGAAFNFLRLQKEETIVEHYAWLKEARDFRLMGTDTIRLTTAPIPGN